MNIATESEKLTETAMLIKRYEVLVQSLKNSLASAEAVIADKNADIAQNSSKMVFEAKLKRQRRIRQGLIYLCSILFVVALAEFLYILFA